MNKYLQKKQLDLHVQPWNNGQVSTKYFTSSFLGHSTAADLFEKLTESLTSLPLNKVTQLSMDGPNGNWKLFHDFQQHLGSNFQLHWMSDRVGCTLCTMRTKQGCKLQTGMLTAFYRACTRCSTMHQPADRISSRRQNTVRFPCHLFPTVGWRTYLSLRGPCHCGSTWKSTSKSVYMDVFFDPPSHKHHQAATN